MKEKLTELKAKLEASAALYNQRTQEQNQLIIQINQLQGGIEVLEELLKESAPPPKPSAK